MCFFLGTCTAVKAPSLRNASHDKIFILLIWRWKCHPWPQLVFLQIRFRFYNLSLIKFSKKRKWCQKNQYRPFLRLHMAVFSYQTYMITVFVLNFILRVRTQSNVCLIGIIFGKERNIEYYWIHTLWEICFSLVFLRL